MSHFIGRLGEKKRQQIKSALNVAIFGAVRLLGLLVRLMSRRQARRVACLLGDFVHYVVGLRRELVYTNIGISFPEKSPAEIRSISASVYRNMAVTLIEVLRFPLIRNREDVAALVDMDVDVSEFKRKTRNGQTGAVMVSGHFGNWELMALAFGIMVKPVTMIVKHLTNDLVDRKMNELRTLRGNSVVYDNLALRKGLKVLSDGGVLAILADQSDPSATYFGEFLGRRATMFNGAAFFALKAQVPLFVGMCRSISDGKYKIEMLEINTSDLTFCKEDIVILSSRYTRVLEEYIQRWPEEWFWLHNRWKNGGAA
ncbi:MAG: lysophospholipid acyltransferase family protein [Chlorobiaceae bacterium]